MLTLKILSPGGEAANVVCDSITLTVKDNSQGKGGGSYGIRTGHAPALIATDKGVITAKKDGQIIFSDRFDEGMATVDSNTVTVITLSGSKS